MVYPFHHWSPFLYAECHSIQHIKTGFSGEGVKRDALISAACHGSSILASSSYSPFNSGTSLSRCCARHFTNKCFTSLSCKWVPGWAEMAMCTISNSCRNACRAACYPMSWNGTATNRSRENGLMSAEGTSDAKLFNFNFHPLEIVSR